MIAFNTITAEALQAANINPRSMLATDYLNHFNEVVMMMEMVPDIPAMIEDVLTWEPCSYKDHFEQSVFADKALAIAAYEAAPGDVRHRFDAVIAEIDAQVTDIQILLSSVNACQPMDPAIADRLMLTIVGQLRPAIDRASALINSKDDAETDLAAGHEEGGMRAQDTIDQMFDEGCAATH
ncbi:MAG: hypothetical protein AAF590_07350 [Pseudomonadota bacterium]